LPERNAAIPLRGLKPTIGFAASLLAAWCQILLLATISLAPLAIGDAGDATPPAQQKPAHPTHDCALCVFCLSHAMPAALLSPAPALPERQSVATGRLAAAYPRAPPPRPVAAAQPRGPPSLT
jgi:hypothetical protein